LNHREVDDIARFMFDGADLDPRWSGRRRALHEEEVAGRPMRIPLHHHGAVAQVRQQHRGDVSVVLKQIAFGQPELAPEYLAEIGETDFFLLDNKNRVVLVPRNDEAHVEE
jgi:hypothetical protein